MAQIKVVATGGLLDVPEPCVYDTAARMWRCGTDLSFLDFDGTEYEAIAPAATCRTRVSRPEFKQLLTAAERIAIRAARAYSGSDAGGLAVKAGLDDLYDILDDPALSYVDLTLPATTEGVAMLAAAGLIASERAAEILRGWPD